MASTFALLAGAGIAAASGYALVWYLKHHLRGVLVDLCGTETRADFWVAFSNAILILVPVLFALEFPPGPVENVPLATGLSHQLKWIFLGLVLSLLSLGVILSLFIRRETRAPAPR